MNAARQLLALIDDRLAEPADGRRYPTLDEYAAALRALHVKQFSLIRGGRPMTTEAKPWAVGDPCPACSKELRPVPPPTDAQRAAAANRDNPTPLPPTVDSATPEQLAELGALHRCDCGYQSRVVAAKKKPKSGGSSDE